MRDEEGFQVPTQLCFGSWKGWGRKAKEGTSGFFFLIASTRVFTLLLEDRSPRKAARFTILVVRLYALFALSAAYHSH
jgi:hypothetical protein